MEAKNYLAAISACIAFAAVIVSVINFRGQRRLSQRQLLLPLWEYISTLNDIDAQNPITPDVLKVVNTLELVALTCEGGMVDDKVIKRTFKDLYIKLYDQVSNVAVIPGLNKSGKQLLTENRAAMSFYDELLKEHKGHGKLKK